MKYGSRNLMDYGCFSRFMIVFFAQSFGNRIHQLFLLLFRTGKTSDEPDDVLCVNLCGKFLKLFFRSLPAVNNDFDMRQLLSGNYMPERGLFFLSGQYCFILSNAASVPVSGMRVNVKLNSSVGSSYSFSGSGPQERLPRPLWRWSMYRYFSSVNRSSFL